MSEPQRIVRILPFDQLDLNVIARHLGVDTTTFYNWTVHGLPAHCMDSTLAELIRTPAEPVIQFIGVVWAINKIGARD